MENCSQPRRTILKRMAYVAPIVLTLGVTPTFARNGSGCDEDRGGGRKERRKNPGPQRPGPGN